jgi:predicted RNA-binding protein associated with RNAse of E/G family
MTLHSPKLITSAQGLGVGTKKQIDFITNDLAIGTETWGQLEAPWVESGKVIAQKDYRWVTKWETSKPYIITKFYDDSNKLIGTYCDISSCVQRVENGFEFYDMYLDVWQTPNNDPVILDVDELEAALAAGFITPEEARDARRAAKKVIELIKNKPNLL